MSDKEDRISFDASKFDYIGFHKTDEGNKIDDFTLFAKIISYENGYVTFERYQKFGKIKWRKPVIIPINKFNKYYIPITDEIFEIIEDNIKE